MNLLIIEDERALSASICSYLSSGNYHCDEVHHVTAAINQIECNDYDCVILDIGLPGGSGLEVLKRLKKLRKKEGVLIISAKNSLDDKVTGLMMGADDYLTKPFHLSELGARIAAIIRRKSFEGNTELHFDIMTLNLEQKLLMVNNTVVDLTRKEYDLLLFFLSNKNKVISKSALAEHIWGDLITSESGYDYIYTHIKNLRRKLSLAGSPDYIQSVYGMGYKLRIPT